MKLFYEHALVPFARFQAAEKKLASYRAHLARAAKSKTYESDEASLALPSDGRWLKEAAAVAQKVVSKKLRYVVVIGIGGSNLGARAIYDALFGHQDVLEPNRYPKLLFLDTVDGAALHHTAAMLTALASAQEFLLVVVSKTGTTLETAANFEALLVPLQKRFGAAVFERTVIISDRNSPLWRAGSKQNTHCLEIPKSVGGRYSVFTAVGLFPLLVAGIDVQALLEGARDMRSACLTEKSETNPALAAAAIVFAHAQKHKTIHDTFVFAPALESLGKWYRQLLGESVGKEKDTDGKTVHAGITPTVSVGTIDLHSVGQLYLGGPRDKITTFVTVENAASTRVPAMPMFPQLAPALSGKTFASIMASVCAGVLEAYKKRRLPFMTIVFARIDAYELGQFLQIHMMQTMYLARMMHVFAFDQPNVELYKKETAKILRNEG